MSHGQGKPRNVQGNVREKSGNFVRAHGWTPWKWFMGWLHNMFMYPKIVFERCWIKLLFSDTQQKPSHVFCPLPTELMGAIGVALSVRSSILPSICPSITLFSCDQAALWMVFSVRLSVCPSVRLSVCHTFLTMFPSSYHHEIFRSYHIGPG